MKQGQKSRYQETGVPGNTHKSQISSPAGRNTMTAPEELFSILLLVYVPSGRVRGGVTFRDGFQNHSVGLRVREQQAFAWTPSLRVLTLVHLTHRYSTGSKTDNSILFFTRQMQHKRDKCHRSVAAHRRRR